LYSKKHAGVNLTGLGYCVNRACIAQINHRIGENALEGTARQIGLTIPRNVLASG
jgi:hypothetical protein